MKTFNQFKHDMNEGVAALAIPAGVGVLKKIAASSALKAIGSGALTGGALTGAYLASKKISDMSDDEIERQGTVDDMKLGGKSKRDKIKKAVGNIIRDVKKGLAAGQEVPKLGAKGRFSNPNAQIVRDMMKKKAEKGDTYAQRFMQQIKDKRANNKEIDRKLKPKD